jgi:hypothetical protein
MCLSCLSVCGEEFLFIFEDFLKSLLQGSRAKILFSVAEVEVRV